MVLRYVYYTLHIALVKYIFACILELYLGTVTKEM